jgi:hypothetical protein
MYAMFVRLIGIEKRDLGDGNDGISREVEKRTVAAWSLVGK